MRRLCLVPCFTALFLAAGVLSAPVPAQIHEDNNWGFKIRVPKDWRIIPLKANERWILGKYQSNRAYQTKEGYEHRPEMKMIIFPEQRKKEKGSGRVRVENDGETVRVTRKGNYKDYKDYLKKNFAGGGYYDATDPEEDTISGVRVTKYDIKVEKGARAKRRIIAWVFHLPDADLAVDIEVLEKKVDKLKSMIRGSLKTFQLAERTGKAPDQGSDPTEEFISPKKWEKMTPIQRMNYRKKRVAKIIQAAVDNLPEGWKQKKSPHFTVLTHVDAKFTKKIINQAEAIRNYLDKNFYEIGDEYVPESIIRICIDSNEENAYRRGSGDAYSSETREVTVAKKTNISRQYEMEWLSQGICGQWFSDKNDNLSSDMPPWIMIGMVQYVATGICKGKKLAFKPNDAEKTSLREGRRNDKLVMCQDLLKMTTEDFNKATRKSGWALLSQSGSMVRYLMSSKCRKSKLTKNIIITYMMNLNAVVTEAKKKDKKSDKREEAETAEEEQARRKADKEAARKRARFVVDESFKRTFGHWTDKDWAAFERGWAKAAR